MNKKPKNYFGSIVNLCTIAALILQCIPLKIPSWLNWCIAVIVIILIIVSAILDIKNKNAHKHIVSKKDLANLTINLMENASENVVMFGGDLSWADEYSDTIKNLTKGSKTVEIILPAPKMTKAKSSVRDKINKRIEQLKDCGAEIYCTPEDIGLRCTLVDVNTVEISDLRILSCKRVKNSFDDKAKNQYRVYCFDSSDEYDKIMCNLFLRNYIFVKSGLEKL